MQSRLNLGADFAFPKLHAKWARAVAGEALEQALRAGSVQALSRTYEQYGVAVRARKDVQKRLTLHLLQDLAEIAHLLKPAMGDFYLRLIDRFFLENLKTVLHYRYVPDESTDISYLLVDIPQLPPLNAQMLLEARSVHQFYSRLPANKFKADLLEILVELDDSKDMFVAETQIDALYYDHLTAALEALPPTARGVARELVRSEIDTVNIITILRNVTVYKLDRDRVAALMIPGATMDDEKLKTTLADQESQSDVVGLLPEPYRKILGAYVERPLYMSENALWGYVFALAQAHFYDYNRPIRAVPAYPFLRRFEHQNLARLFEGKYLHLNPAVIRTMMIGLDHVQAG